MRKSEYATRSAGRHWAVVLVFYFAFQVPCRGAPGSGLSGQQRMEVDKSLAAFGQATASAQRQAAVDRVLQYGPPAAELLLQRLASKSRLKWQTYQSLLEKQLVATFKARMKTNKKEVRALQTEAAAVRRKPDFAKQDIAEVIEPALKRLSELLLLSVDEVVQQSKSLKPKHDELVELAEYEDACLKLVKGKGESLAVQMAKHRAAAAMAPLYAEVRATKVVAWNAQQEEALDPEEVSCVRALNRMRLLLGLNVLQIDPRLCEAARDHSNDMNTLNFFSHDSPVEGKGTPWERARRFGASATGENINHGQEAGVGANNGWLHSPGHHQNMFGRHTLMGVGKSGTYWTELFR
jgi:uncharacterized protein YkwD